MESFMLPILRRASINMCKLCLEEKYHISFIIKDQNWLLNAALKVNIYFVIWYLIELHDLQCQPCNSHMTKKKKKFIFVQLNLTKSDVLNISSPENQLCETLSCEFLSGFIIILVYN